MSAAPHTTLSAAHPRHSIESVMDHFRYCADLVGLDHVAFGPDTLYGDHVALHRIFAHLLSIGAARGPSFDPVAYVDGLENPTENFANICGWLVQHGFDDTEIRAVLGGNIYRALQSIWVLRYRTGAARRSTARTGSIRLAAASSAMSAPRGADSWIPTGSPPSHPQGRTSAGSPVRLKTPVNIPSSSPSGVSTGGVVTGAANGAAGVISTSTPRYTCAARGSSSSRRRRAAW